MLSKPVHFWLALTTVWLLVFPSLVSTITPPPQNKRRPPRPPRYNYINQCRQPQPPGPPPPQPGPPPPQPPPQGPPQPAAAAPPPPQNNPNYYKMGGSGSNSNTRRRVRRNADGTIDFKIYSTSTGRLIKSCKVYPNDLEGYAFIPLYGYGAQGFNSRDAPPPPPPQPEEDEDKYWDEDGFFNQPFWNWYDDETVPPGGTYDDDTAYNDPYASRANDPYAKASDPYGSRDNAPPAFGAYKQTVYRGPSYCVPGVGSCGDNGYYQTIGGGQGYRKVCKLDDKSVETWYTYEGKLLKEKKLFDKDGLVTEKWVYENGGYFVTTNKPNESYIEEEYNGDTQIRKKVEYLNNGFKVQTDYFPDGSKRRYRFNDDDELVSGYFEDKFGNIFEEEGWI